MDSPVDFFISEDSLPKSEDESVSKCDEDAADQLGASGIVGAIDHFRHALLDRDPEVQLAGLRKVMDLLKSKGEDAAQWRDALIDGNLIETLAETISSLNTHIVCSSFRLLEDLIQSNSFIVQNRASIIVNSVLRSVQIYSELSEDGAVVNMGLDLVSKMIMVLVQGGKELRTFCDLEQLVNVNQTILKSPNEDLSILQSVSQIVYTLLLSSKALLEDETEKDVSFPHLVAEVLNQLCRATHNDPDIDIDTAICEVGAASMRLFVKATGSKREVLEPLHAMIRTAMTNLIVPHINEWVPSTDQSSMGDMLALLKGVMSMYHYTDPVENFKYTQLLVDANFLIILHSLELFCRTWMQYMVVRSLLVEILVCLCSNVLGEMDWAAVVTESLKTLPVQGSLSRLETYSFQDPISTTIILYNYFLLTASDCPEISVDLFKDICTHVNLSKSPIPFPVFKAVWLCFAVGYLTHGDSCYLAETTNYTIISSLTTVYDLEKVFTHHPAILYWTFRSESLLKDIKTGVMNLWMKVDEENTTQQLKSLLSQSRESFTVYLVRRSMSITQLEHLKKICFRTSFCELLPSLALDEDSISKHLSIFPDLLQRCDEQFIELVSYDAWSMLPQVLLRSCLRIESLGVIPLLVFCCEFQPQLIDQDLLLRIACLLPGTISKQNSITEHTSDHVPSPDSPLKYIVIFKFMWVLFNKVQERNESMILSPLLNHERFLIALECSLKMKHDELTIIVLGLLSTMLTLQHKHSAMSCRNVVITGGDLAILLYSNGGIATAAVKMLHSLVTVDPAVFSSRLLVTIEMPHDHLRAIYVRLHMICSLGTDELSSCCWTVIHRLLVYAQDVCCLKGHISSLPYTHDLIRTCSPGTLAWDRMMEFLPVWLSCQSPVAGDRSLGKAALDDTLQLLAQHEISL